MRVEGRGRGRLAGADVARCAAPRWRAGVGVGVELGVTPLPEKELTSGEHTVRVKTACGEVTRAGFEVLAERTTPLTAADLPGFATAELRVTATTHLDEHVPDLAVFVDDQQLATPAAGAPWAVPACRLRVRVAAVGRDDLGGVIEDIEFVADSKVERAVVLAPGPDMVRIPGGSFVFGPNEAGKKWLREMSVNEGFYAADPPWDNEDPRLGAKVELPAFEIDKTEVTVAEYMACRRAAKRTWCYDEADCDDVGACGVHVAEVPSRLPFPPSFMQVLEQRRARGEPPDPRNCFLADLEATEHDPGDSSKPMNCLVPWEAARYCNWAGKRLATDVEWEYVARSRRTDHSQPWGEVDEEDCGRSVCRSTPEQLNPQPVCTKPLGNSIDGVCDMMGNVAELTIEHEIVGRGTSAHAHHIKGSSVDDATIFAYESGNQAPFAVGFRCARDLQPL